MTRAQLGIRPAGSVVEPPPAGADQVPGQRERRVVEPIVGRDGGQDGHGTSATDPQRLGRIGRVAVAVDDQSNDDREPDSRVLAAVAGPGGHHQLGSGPAIGDAALAARVLQRERGADARLAGIEAQHHDIVGGRHERLAPMADTRAPILHRGDRGPQVEPPAVVAHGCLRVDEFHRQVAGRLVAARRDARAKEMALTVAFRLEVAAGGQQAPELGDVTP